MSDPTTVVNVLERYPIASVNSVEALGGAGGFSGAAFWKVKSGDSTLCLRRWPKEHPSQDRLAAIHRVLCHVSKHGYEKVPAPIGSLNGKSFVSVAGHFWELTHWLPGSADFHQHPSSQRLAAGMEAIARFHRATESCESFTDVPPGILSRRRQLERLRVEGIAPLLRAISTLAWPEFFQRASTVLHAFNEQASQLAPLLESASQLRVPLQPCIRDIWHDHVLFEGDEVSGLVDFGAMRVDHVACDISRLLGSLVKGDRDRWHTGLAAYQSLRQLSADELSLVNVYDRSTVLLSGMNWVQWIAVEGRKFDDPQRVLRRMDDIIERLLRM